MFLLILLAINGLFTSCTTSDKPSNESTQVKVEKVAEPVATNQTTESTIATLKEEVPSETQPAVEKEREIKTNAPSKPKVEHVSSDELPKVKEVVMKEERVTSSPVVEKAAVETEIKEDPPTKSSVDKKEAAPGPIAGHGDFNALLQKHVKNGLVNYAGFKTDGAKLDAYLDFLSSNAPSTNDKSKAALAYWMNAYNAFTIKLIVDNLPVKSIMDLHGGKPWDKKWITLGGKSYSLNGIEHDVIRPVFNEPRIHFAIVCAAKSCPPIDNQAFTASNVDANLERLTKTFINNPKFNTLTESKITITPIMDWYAKDFGNVVSYVQQYADVKVSDKAKVKFTDYDWSLNKQ